MPLWARLLVMLAGAKVAFGLVLYFSGVTGRASPLLLPMWVYAGLSTAFAILGGLLAAEHRRDPRAAWLGGVLMLIAAPLTPLVNAFASPWPGGLPYFRPEAALPAFLWRFLAEFPSPLGGTALRVVRALAAGSLAVGGVCLVANLSMVWPDLPRAAWRGPLLVSGGYWLFVLGLSLPAIPALLWRGRTAAPKDQARVQIFVRALTVGLAPFAVQVVAEELVPAYKAFAATPAVRPVIGAVLFGCLATVPFATAYSVLFDRVVEVRVVVRAALQYALARYSILAITAIPFAAFALLLFEHRAEPLVSMMAGPRPLLLIGAVLAGVVALRLRHGWLAGVDRRYFREPYDAQQVLARFIGELHATGVEDLARRIKEEVARTLHADAEVLFSNDARTALRHPEGRLGPLPTTAMLVGLAVNDPRPMDIDLEAPDSPLRRLPDAEKQWLSQEAIRLVVAVRSGDAIAGLLVLTAKRSGLHYSAVDRQLLSALSAAAGLALDSLRLRSTPVSPSEPPARECLECSRLNPADAPRCACGGAVVEATAPHVLRGVFRLEQRIGAGGMGVVYRAIDLNLGRDVAVKTLPKVSADEASRLRREARAMAAVTHGNLAVVHGIETWQGIPFLIEEYLAGGTLGDRLARGPLPLSEVLQLGLTLADALEQLHAGGILHCDIKPSNIGFTQRGVVKLLDFGLARLLRDTSVPHDAPTTQRLASAPGRVAVSGSGMFQGTPHYMAPEIIHGERPTPAVDVWALSVVLFEALAGQRPFDGDDSSQIFRRVLAPERPTLARHLTDCPPELDRVFTRLLSLDPRLRPRDAMTLVRVLTGIAEGRPMR